MEYLQSQASDYAKVVATPAQRPEEIGVLGLGGVDD